MVIFGFLYAELYLLMLVLNWLTFRFKHILKMYIFTPLPNSFFLCHMLYLHVYPLIVYCGYSCFYNSLSFNLHTCLFNWMMLSPYPILVFPRRISPFLSILNLSLGENPFSVSLVLINSFSFCMSEKFFISSSILC